MSTMYFVSTHFAIDTIYYRPLLSWFCSSCHKLSALERQLHPGRCQPCFPHWSPRYLDYYLELNCSLISAKIWLGTQKILTVVFFWSYHPLFKAGTSLFKVTSTTVLWLFPTIQCDKLAEKYIKDLSQLPAIYGGVKYKRIPTWKINLKKRKKRMSNYFVKIYINIYILS